MNFLMPAIILTSARKRLFIAETISAALLAAPFLSQVITMRPRTRPFSFSPKKLAAKKRPRSSTKEFLPLRSETDSSAMFAPSPSPGNQVPLPGSNSFDPNAAILLNTGIIPAPTSNTGCNSSIGSCYDAAVSTPTDWREELFRLDHNFTPNVKATFRYIHDTWSTTTTVPQWGFIQNSFPTIQTKFVGPGLDMVARV